MANLDYNDFRRCDCGWRMVLPDNSLKLLDFLGSWLACGWMPRNGSCGIGQASRKRATMPHHGSEHDMPDIIRSRPRAGSVCQSPQSQIAQGQSIQSLRE